jgi:hypothetical protein
MKCFQCRRYTEKKCNALGWKVSPNYVCNYCPFADMRTLYLPEVQKEIWEEVCASSFGYSMLEAELELMDYYETY